MCVLFSEYSETFPDVNRQEVTAITKSCITQGLISLSTCVAKYDKLLKQTFRVSHTSNQKLFLMKANRI